MDGSWIVALGEGEYARGGWQFRLRQWGMRVREESVSFAWLQRVQDALLSCRLGHVGLYLLLSGMLLLILTLIVDRFAGDARHSIASCVLILSAIPLLGSTVSLSSALHQSNFARIALFGLCGVPAPPIEASSEGQGFPMSVLLLSLCSLALAWVLSPFAFCMLLLCTPLVLLLLSVPELGVCATVAVLPLLQLTPRPTVSLSLLTFLCLFSFACKAFCGRRDFSVRPLDLTVALFCVLLGIGGLIGYGRAEDGVCLMLLSFMYFPTRNLFSSLQWRRKLRTSVLFSVSAVSFFGILEYVLGYASVLWVDTDRFSDLGGRVTSFFQNPNVLAIYLLLCIPIVACASLDSREGKLRRALFFVSLLVGILCLVFTWTRGAWLGLLGEAVVFLLHRYRCMRKRGIFLLGCLPGALSFLPQQVIHRFASIGSASDSSVRYRFYIWQGVGRMIEAHPFGIGVGEHAFRTVYPHYALSGIESAMHAHQIFLQILAELGVGGVVVFAAMLLFLFFKGWFGRDGMGGLYAVCGVTVMGLFDHLWYCPGMICLFFILCGLIGEEDA